MANYYRDFPRQRGGAIVWDDGSPASVILNNEFFEFVNSYSLTAESGSFTVTGQAAGLISNRILVAEEATVAVSGQAANMTAGRLLSAENASFSLTGQEAQFIKGFTLVADVGNFTVIGQAANLIIARVVQANTGNVTVTGQDAGVRASRVLYSDFGSVTVTGQDAELRTLNNYSLTAAFGSVVFTGQAANVVTQRLLTGQGTNYTISGQAELKASRKITAANANITTTGNTATLGVFVIPKVSIKSSTTTQSGDSSKLNTREERSTIIYTIDDEYQPIKTVLTANTSIDESV